MHRKLLKSSLVLAGLMVALSPSVMAADAFKPKEEIFLKGADLNDEQLKETKAELKVDDDVTNYDVSSTDVVRYTGTEYDYIHSSAVIIPNKIMRGVDVEIETPDMITRITKEQYMNAAITAGIQDAKIKIASIDPVSGEGALSGIYKAYEEQGQTLNQQDIQNAHTEMNELAQISENHTNQDTFSDEALNEAIADMKEQIAEATENNQQINDVTINQLVNQTLNEKGLNTILNDEEVAMIQKMMMNVAESEVIQQDPEAFKKQAKDIVSQIRKESGDQLDRLKEFDTSDERNFLQKLWDAIVAFLKQLWYWLTSFL
ncbi:DUF1002 domain-containing protein [Staphylococcus sp. 11262D007BW]